MRIIFSGLYERVTAVHCFLVGEKEFIDIVTTLIHNLGSKFKITATGPGDTSYERFTLHRIHDIIVDGDKFLYIHSKGIKDINHFTKKESPKDHIYLWRTWMEYFLIGKFKTCLEKLNEYDIVGINYLDHYIGPHFSGNFWWSNAAYYKSLPRTVPKSPNPKEHYNDPEKYIFRRNPIPKYYDMDENRVKNSFKSQDAGLTLYDALLYPKYYTDDVKYSS